jgi:hypothetical protein
MNRKKSSPKESVAQAASHFSVILSPPTAHKEVLIPADDAKEGDSTATLIDQDMKGTASNASSLDNHCHSGTIDIVDDATNGLSMLAREVESDGTVVNVKGQRSNIFQSECKIQDKVCKLIIDGGSFTNAISSDVVHALSLSTRRLPMPRYIQWMNQSGTLKITHKARVKFSIGNYVDTVDCDIAPMSACHLLLGRPW